MDMSQKEFLFEKQLIEGLIQNREMTEKWQKRKKEHEDLKGNLSYYTNKMKHKIMAPLGNKAMVKAHLIHTNEILVSLGVGWFVKVAAIDAKAICDRRIEECDKMLKKFETEKILYESRRLAKMRSDAFGGMEIVENYDENQEKKWREEHREKVKQHKQKLAEVKNNLKETSTVTEDDMWKRLDMLELQEELVDELARMDEDDIEETSDDEISESEHESDIEGEDSNNQNEPVRKKSVTFDLNPVTEVYEPSEDPTREEISLITTSAIKDEISETKSSTSSNATRSSRPASKFKQSRQHTS